MFYTQRIQDTSENSNDKDSQSECRRTAIFWTQVSPFLVFFEGILLKKVGFFGIFHEFM